MKDDDAPKTRRIANCCVLSRTWENLFITTKRMSTPRPSHSMAVSVSFRTSNTPRHRPEARLSSGVTLGVLELPDEVGLIVGMIRAGEAEHFGHDLLAFRDAT